MFNRPTLPQIIDRVRNDLLARLQIEDVLRRSDAEVYARTQAAAVHYLYAFADYIARETLVDTATDLERHGSLWGVERKPAAKAVGTATFTTQVGAVIPLDALLQAFDGVEYRVSEAGTATGATLTVAIEAVAEGASGNREAGQSLSLVSPIAGVQSNAGASALSGGADTENDDAYRERILTHIRRPPHGGNQNDYVAWAKEVPGVTRAWCYPQELGLGTVTVRFVRDEDVSLIPDAVEVALVQAYLDARRPVTAALTVVAPIAVPLTVTIANLSPNTPAVRAAIAAELKDLLRREAQPGGTIFISHLREAISLATAEFDHTLVSPTANATHTTGEIATLGAIAWL